MLLTLMSNLKMFGQPVVEPNKIKLYPYQEKSLLDKKKESERKRLQKDDEEILAIIYTFMNNFTS